MGMSHSPEIDKLAAALAAPFPAGRVSWRLGATTADKSKGRALAYIDARDVMERLDAVCGVGGWQCRYPHANGKTVCEIGILITRSGVQHGNDFWDGWVWKADGAGDTDVEAEKGALSDAFKRAAVRWGVGRYLYDLDSPWVEIEKAGNSYKIKASEMQRLDKLAAARGAGHALTPPATGAATVPLKAERQPASRAPTRPGPQGHPEQWKTWAEYIVALPPRELSDWLASDDYAEGMAACKKASPKLHDWIEVQIRERNAA